MRASLTWGRPYDSSPHSRDASRLTFPFDLKQEQPGALRDITSQHEIGVLISGTLKAMWTHHVEGEQYVRVMFEYARRAALQRLLDGRLPDYYEVELFTNTAPSVPPFDPDKISSPEGHIDNIDLEAVREQRAIMERENRALGFQLPSDDSNA